MHRQRCKGALNYTNTFTLADDLNWATQGLGGRMKQHRKYSSQMEEWRGQRSGVVRKREEMGKGKEEGETCEKKERGQSLCSPLSLKTH